MESVNDINKKLLYSSRDGDLEGVVEALVQGGTVSVRNPLGFTPLLTAAQNGHTDICGLLLEHGSDVNEVTPETNWTALNLAALKGHEAVVEALLSWGANVDLHDHQGLTPLYFACQAGHLACVLPLLKASVSMPNNNGGLPNPIHIAAHLNSPDMVSFCENTLTTILTSSLPFSCTVRQGRHHS